MGIDEFRESDEAKYTDKESSNSSLQSVSNLEQAKEALQEYKDRYGEYPDTYSDWDSKKDKLGYSTSAQNFKQNTDSTMTTIVEMLKGGESLYECKDCGNKFKTLGGHLSQTDCEYYEIDEETYDLLKGLWLSDGWIAESSNDRWIMHVEMVNKEFMEWFKSKTSIPFSDIKLRKDASQSAKDARESGFSPNAEESNYSDIYRMSSMAHPQLAEFNSMNKTDIDINDTVASMWYCGDGSVHWSGDYSFIQITISNKVSEVKKLTNQLEERGYNVSIDEIQGMGKAIRFDRESSIKFLDDILGPIDGFEYKWEIDSRDRYEELKEGK